MLPYTLLDPHHLLLLPCLLSCLTVIHEHAPVPKASPLPALLTWLLATHNRCSPGMQPACSQLTLQRPCSWLLP